MMCWFMKKVSFMLSGVASNKQMAFVIEWRFHDWYGIHVHIPVRGAYHIHRNS